MSHASSLRLPAIGPRVVAVAGSMAFAASWLSALGAMRLHPHLACAILAFGMAAAVAAAHGHVLGLTGPGRTGRDARVATAIETCVQIAAIASAVWVALLPAAPFQ